MLPVPELEHKLGLARSGDSLARNDLLDTCRPFIARVAQRLCGRRLDWGRDDELSIGLIAFNEAIDRFEEGRQVPFLAFARLIIRSRVTDYLRRETRQTSKTSVSLEAGDEQGIPRAEVAKAWDSHMAEEAAREREEEIREYQEMLSGFGIAFEDLVRCAPKHRDARAGLLAVSRQLAARPDLFKELLQKKKLPARELERLTGTHRKTLERGRKYIIATTLIWYYCEDFLYLCNYLKPTFGKGGK